LNDYLHGYSDRETQRLDEQSGILEDLLHGDTAYPDRAQVLEAGCGVGAQTKILARRSPGASFTSVDISPGSLDRAESNVRSAGIENVTFQQADLNDLPFPANRFDHLFVCFVLEHLADPPAVLAGLKRVLKPGGTLTAIEGDHGSCFWSPETAESRLAWTSMITSQQVLGHDPNIGRRLFPLLMSAGFDVKEVVPKWVYTDANNPVLMDGVLNKIIVPMVKTARTAAIESGLIDEATFEQGTADLERAGTPPNGTFFYTWFKGLALKPVSR
jgi:SAM-dependent methyltransferase